MCRASRAYVLLRRSETTVAREFRANGTSGRGLCAQFGSGSLSRINPASLEFLEHLFGDELVAGIVPVVAVVGQDSATLIVRVVLLPVLDERFAKVVHGHALCLDHLALHRGEFVEFRVVLVRAVVLLADARERTLDDLNLLLL